MRSHYTYMWWIDNCNKCGIKRFQTRLRWTGMILFPTSCRYGSTTIKVLSILCRDVTIHRCITKHRYFATTIRIDTADLVYRHSLEIICTGILEKDESKCILFLIRLMEILWYNSAKSRFVSTSGSCSSRYSTGVAGYVCMVLLITGVSAFMLLTTSLSHLTVFRYVSRYVSYRNLCIEIRIVSLGARIITPLILCLDHQ